MPRRVVERLVCYVVHTGVGSSHGCSYDRSATYDDWDALMADVKEALEADRQVMIEPCLNDGGAVQRPRPGVSGRRQSAAVIVVSSPP